MLYIFIVYLCGGEVFRFEKLRFRWNNGLFNNEIFFIIWYVLNFILFLKLVYVFNMNLIIYFRIYCCYGFGFLCYF